MSKIKQFIETIAIAIKWTIAHFIKKALIVMFCFLIIPMILLSMTFELLGNFFKLIHDLFEELFVILYDLNKPFIIALFKSMGFIYGQIYLGDTSNRVSLLKLKEIAKDNGIRCYIIDEMVRIEDSYYAKIIVPKDTDLNLLKLIFNTSHNNKTPTIF